MANWYGVARSNRFTVKDHKEFLEEIANLELDVHQEDSDPNTVVLFSDTEDGAFASYFYDDEQEEYVDVDLPTIIQRHITEDSCAILMEAGNEKLRYITGWSCAISSKEIVYVNLNEIYKHAEEMMGKPVNFAEY